MNGGPGRVHFEHSTRMWTEFPELAAAVLHADGITRDGAADHHVAALCADAERRLAAGPESELPEIQAWRRAFSKMGLKPTQYRCAAEALLRRFRKEGALPRIHPLIDLCNAVSLAFAIPVAVFDLAEVDGHLEVRHADGDEAYLAFSGEVERPDADEVIFADAARRAHARRWTNRQSRWSAVSDSTSAVLIVAEALHGSATEDVSRLAAVTADALSGVWSVDPAQAVLTRSSPRFVVPETTG